MEYHACLVIVCRYMNIHRYPQFVAYLPVQCMPLSRGRPMAELFRGKTESISVGGIGLLLPAIIPRRTPLLVQVGSEEPRRGLVIWVDRRTATNLGSSVSHGVAFDRLVEPALVQHWMRDSRRQSHPRVSVQFGVEYSRGRIAGHGTCLNLSRGGMFIATNHPARPGTELLLYFKPPSLACPVLVLAQVVWVRGEEMVWMHEEEIWPGAILGMGIQFVDPNPSVAALIGSIVDRLRQDASMPPHF